MATKRPYSRWGLAAIAGGAVLTGIEVIGAVGYLVSQNQPSYLVLGGAVVTVLSAALLPLAESCWRRRRYFQAALLMAALAPALSIIVFAAVERTGGARDEADRGRQALALKAELARKSEKEAAVTAQRATEKAETECSRSKNPKADPRGPLCTAAEERADKAAKALKSARGELAQAGVVPKDPTASRFAAVFPVTEEAVALYQPLVLPLTISALGLLLIAVGAPLVASKSPKSRKSRKRWWWQRWRQRWGKRKKKGQPKPAPPRKPSSDKVVPLRRKSA